MASCSMIEKIENLSKLKVEEFVTVKLSDHTTYLTWKSMMLRFLHSIGLHRFITKSYDGSCDHEECKRVDEMVRRWILATISENVLTDRMENSETSNKLLKMLEHDIFWTKRYEYVSNVKVEEFVTVKLSDHTTYLTWKSMMLSLAQSNDLLSFICRNDWDDVLKKIDDKEDEDEDEKRVANENLLNDDKSDNEDEDEDEYEDRKRMDDVVRRWILDTLNENLLTDRSKNSKTSKELWKMLEQDHMKESESYIRQYLPLLKASINSDWEKATKFLEQHPDSVRAIITENLETALMLAARTVQRNNFVKKLVDKMSPADLAMVDNKGATALHMAARAGYTGAAKVLVSKNPRLPNIQNNPRSVPIFDAALFGKKEMVLYLLTVTKDNTYPNPFDLEPGGRLVEALIRSGFYDIACSLLLRYPMGSTIYGTFLLSIVHAHSAFLSGARLNYLQSLIYTFVPVKVNNVEENRINGGDIENAVGTSISGFRFNVRQKLDALFWKVVEISVPQIKHVRDRKLIHHKALQLVKQLVNEIAKLDHSVAATVFGSPLLLAASSGVHEVVEEILDSFPNAVKLANENKQTLFHLAIVNRRENVFNIIYQCQGLSHVFLASTDCKGNNGLHLAGFFGDKQKPILRATAAGAALQMQRELQWFKEVEKLTLTRDKQELNSDKKTPLMLFTETHQELVKEGEKWMKDTASSCTIVAALIVTIVFAAAITIPGGNNGSTGHPIFESEKAFIIFAISDALALLSSTSSLLLFLSILTSRYAEQDFLYALPRRLISGLVTLFISIIFMMVAFGATLQILFGGKNWWVIIPVVGLGSVPVTLFVTLQFPLLIDMIRCTYGSQIFRLQSDRRF